MTTPLQADVCVIGAGPAGLTVAGALAAEGLRVVLLEAGGTEPALTGEEIQLAGENAYPQSDIAHTRGAGLGGTSGIWSYHLSDDETDGTGYETGSTDDHTVPGRGERGCRYAPLDPVDFEARSAVPHSGWPLTRADLDPWYARAQDVCGLGRFDYSAPSWSRDGAPALPLDLQLVESQMFQFGPASAWREVAAGKLTNQTNAVILTHCLVTRMDADPTGSRVQAVWFRRPGGSTGSVQARCTVLAGGGIENSRLLLLSDHEVRGGLGNGHDQVGRFWMEHPLVRGGLLVAPASVGLGARMRLYDAHWRDDGQSASKVMAKLSVAPDLVRREGLLSTSAILVGREDVLVSRAVQAYSAIRSPTGRSAGPLHRARLAARMALGAGDLLRANRLFRHQPGLDRSGWATRPGAGRLRVFEMIHQTEQSPDPGNRITLSGRTDRHGRRIPVLHWRWTPSDRQRIARSRDLYAQAFVRAGLATLAQGDWDGGQPRLLGGNHHHLGGTRMSLTPADGVVDADAKVHGVANLFVAGSSLFPGGGSVNPTLTVVALALRLAHHLRQTLQRLPERS